VVRRREHFRLALKPRQAIRLTGEGVRQDLDGDVALQPRIARARYLAHAAGAQRADHFVGTESIPGAQ
jgi:hypothetical protein